jgi:HSP20 family molecular chaperone IbpA
MVSQSETSELQTRDKQAVERERTRPGLTFRPDVDIIERPDAFLVYADLPGVDDRHVEVRLEDGVLSIEAELASAPEPAWTPLHQEYRMGGWQREFRLSEAIDADAIRAHMRDGVLEVRLPKSERHRPRQIPVQSA